LKRMDSSVTGYTLDTWDSLVVDIVDNAAPLDAGTTADADVGNTLCVVDSEIISYSACALTGTNRYTAGGYLRRGQKGSSVAAHGVGAPFLRLDDAVFKYTFDAGWSGKTIYLKFQSFNRFGNSAQDLSALTASPVNLFAWLPGRVVEFGNPEVTSGPIGVPFRPIGHPVPRTTPIGGVNI
jgi:hypothetical protein